MASTDGLVRHPRLPRWAYAQPNTTDFKEALGVCTFFGGGVIGSIIYALLDEFWLGGFGFGPRPLYGWWTAIAVLTGIVMFTVLYLAPHIIAPKLFPATDFGTAMQANNHDLFVSLTPSQQADVKPAYDAMIAAKLGRNASGAAHRGPEFNHAMELFTKTVDIVRERDFLLAPQQVNPHIESAEDNLNSLKSIVEQLGEERNEQ